MRGGEGVKGWEVRVLTWDGVALSVARVQRNAGLGLVPAVSAAAKAAHAALLNLS